MQHTRPHAAACAGAFALARALAFALDSTLALGAPGARDRDALSLLFRRLLLGEPRG
jgi:hypothetical protein